MFQTKQHLIIILMIFGLQYTDIALAEIFKCKTADGQTIYSGMKCADNAKVFTPVIDKLGKPNEQAEPVEAKPKVDIYITSWCPYCKRAMAYLNSKDIAFNAYDIEKDIRAKAEKQKILPGYTGVPLTIINGEKIKGFSEKSFNKALAKKISSSPNQK